MSLEPVREETRAVLPLPYTATAARIPFFVTVGVFVLLEQRTRLRSWRNRRGARSDRGSLVAVVAAVAVGVVAAFLLAGDFSAGTIAAARGPVFVVGLTVMWIGIGIRQWAITELGRFFTVDVRVQEGQAVVDRGPYRWVRHPSYSGMILTLVGMGLALGNWASLTVLAVVPTLGLVLCIRVEERVLLDALGEPYRRFAATRRRLLPGCW